MLFSFSSCSSFLYHFLILHFSLFPMSMMLQGLTPDPKTSCGPYTPTNGTSSRLVYCSLRDLLLKHSLLCFLSHRIRSKPPVDEHNHDTIGKHRFMQPCPLAFIFRLRSMLHVLVSDKEVKSKTSEHCVFQESIFYILICFRQIISMVQL